MLLSRAPALAHRPHAYSVAQSARAMTLDRNKLDRIVEARMQLRNRFQSRHPPAGTDGGDAPRGSGPLNRHGMPKIPVGQTPTKKWPVLDLGHHPRIAPKDWQLVVEGACESPFSLGWEDFLALDQVSDVSDFHCVTTWSRLDVPWVGVRFSDLAALALPHADAHYVLVHAHDGYTTNLSLAEALKPDVLLVHRADGAPLPVEHGGPVRMITPQLYAWKGAKWIRRIEFSTEERLGFWEERGYSSTALPWQDDRYSSG